jgi:hypothetical protein
MTGKDGGSATDGARPDGPLSDPSGASEADGDPPVLEDHRHLPAAGELDHAIELLPVVFDVDVSDRIVAFRVVLTGRGRVGSGVLSEDLDRLGAHASSLVPR